MTSLNGEYALRAEGVGKSYGPVVALRGVTIGLRRGEVLGLIGDNGAGKSTLIKILTGFHQQDEGTIYVGGEEVRLRSVSHARQLGIETVYQDLALIDQLPVYQNMNLNKETVHRPIPFLDKRKMRREARSRLDDMGVRIGSVDTEVGFLSGGQRQAVAIARAVYSDAKVILLDEPLAAMGAKESAIIMDLILEVRRRREVSMILIAHNYAQVLDLCDRVNLLQHGRITYETDVGDTSIQELTELVSADYRGRGQQGSESGAGEGN
jgi:ABC-type sugar transport system ATPase subunit